MSQANQLPSQSPVTVTVVYGYLGGPRTNQKTACWECHTKVWKGAHHGHSDFLVMIQPWSPSITCRHIAHWCLSIRAGKLVLHS